MIIQGKSYDERAAAGEVLIQLAQKHRFGVKEVKVGKFSGFDLSLMPERSDSIFIIGKSTYYAKISDSPRGTVSSLEYTIRFLDDQLVDLKADMADSRKQLEDLKQHVGRSFEHAEKLKTLLARKEELVRELDLTKNQADSNAEAENFANDAAELNMKGKEAHSSIGVGI